MNIFGVSGLLALLVVVLVVVVLVATAVVTIGRARRLDRLHVRVDGARAALVGALDRRAAVVRTVAATPSSVVAASSRRELRAAARAAEEAGDGEDREAAENALTALLTRLRPGVLVGDLAGELADADARVVVARRVHNDAVRDTRALRGRRMVRLLHLAGTAPFPRYFEIVETEPESTSPARLPAPAADPAAPAADPAASAADPAASAADPAASAADPADSAAEPAASAADTGPVPRPGTDGTGPAGNGTGPAGNGTGPAGDGTGPAGDGTASAGDGDGPRGTPTRRRARDAARVVALDPHGRVLLLRVGDAGRPEADFWCTPGGGVEPGEAPHRAAVRHLAETTGVHADPDALTGPAWVRDLVFAAEGTTWSAHEFFYVLRLRAPVAVDTAGAPPAGARTVGGHRWWTATELTATLDPVHPARLGDLLADPASVDPGGPPVPVH